MKAITPGPWHAACNADNWDQAAVYADKVLIASVDGILNARTMAASLELLEACKLALEVIRDNMSWVEHLDMPSPVEDKLESAINKAEGRFS